MRRSSVCKNSPKVKIEFRPLKQLFRICPQPKLHLFRNKLFYLTKIYQLGDFMFRKNNLLAFFVLSASLGTAAYAQTTTVTPTVPGEPQRIERQMRIFTDDGGSYLGVQLQEVTKDNFGKYGLKDVRGAAIEKVSDNSPAKQAGLQDGDVIVKFDGEEVSSVRKLQRLIGEVAPDHQAKVTVLRGGSERDLNVTLGKRPGAAFQNGNFTVLTPNERSFEFSSPVLRGDTFPIAPSFPDGDLFKTQPNGPGGDNLVWNFFSGRRIGVSSMALTKQLGDYFGVADGKGILISSVQENSPAAKAGLKAGDVIVEADGQAVANTAELSKALGNKDKKTINLTILRNKKRQNITVEPEEAKDVLKPAPGVKVMPRNGVTTVAPRVLTLTRSASEI